MSAGYVIADVVFWFLLGLVVDGVTGNWKTLSGPIRQVRARLPDAAARAS